MALGEAIGGQFVSCGELIAMRRTLRGLELSEGDTNDLLRKTLGLSSDRPPRTLTMEQYCRFWNCAPLEVGLPVARFLLQWARAHVEDERCYPDLGPLAAATANAGELIEYTTDGIRGHAGAVLGGVGRQDGSFLRRMEKGHLWLPPPTASALQRIDSRLLGSLSGELSIAIRGDEHEQGLFVTAAAGEVPCMHGSRRRLARHHARLKAIEFFGVDVVQLMSSATVEATPREVLRASANMTEAELRLASRRLRPVGNLKSLRSGARLRRILAGLRRGTPLETIAGSMHVHPSAVTKLVSTYIGDLPSALPRETLRLLCAEPVAPGTRLAPRDAFVKFFAASGG
jgi:hypothetical protein